MASKLVAEPNGGWSGPVDFEVRNIECFVPQAPVGGAIERIAFSGKSAGPSLDALEKLRETIDGLQAEGNRSPESRGASLLAALTSIAAPFGSLSGDFAMDGLIVRNLTGEALVSLAKAGTAFTMTGLDSETAAFRLSVRHDGLDLAPSVLEAAKVPHRALFDLGISDISTQAVGRLLRAAATMANERKEARG